MPKPKRSSHFYARLPLGTIEVNLDRRDLDLGERGGFEAAWAAERRAQDVLEPETCRKLVKTYLNELYRERHGRDAPKISLNLASHQLLDDFIGWSKLNYPPPTE